MSSRQTILAIAIVGLILLLMPKYYNWVSPKKPPVEQAPAPETQKPATADSAAAAATPVVTPPASATTVPAAPERRPGELAPDSLPPTARYVTVETPLYTLVLNSSAIAAEYNLKTHHLHTGEPVDLHHAAEGRAPMIGALDFNFGTANLRTLDGLRFAANRRSLNLTSGRDSILFAAGDSAGQRIFLTYIFDAERYGFELALRTENLPVAETGEYKVIWKGGVPFTEPIPAADAQYGGAYAKVGDDVEDVKVGNDPRKEFTATGQTHFIAARSKYFMAAVIPDGPAAGTDIIGRNEAPKVKGAHVYYDLTLRETWTGNASGRWTVYWGPIKYENLKSLGVGLEETMNWGWAIIKPFSRTILWALTAMHTVIHNYGVVIVIFSILVKVILWPLTRKSQISMKKMAALQPEMTAMRELHKNNPQALNAAIMKLYKDRGVNPASGCIPLLLQMPVLYALFVIFSSTIEFRQAPFLLWISDLSQPDIIARLPFSIPMYGAHVALLPLVMGITQFIMAKRTTTDPNQKMMIYIMPVFMTLIFNSLPSGLTLYYTLFNVLAIVEQNLIKVPEYPSVQVIEEGGKKKKK